MSSPDIKIDTDTTGPRTKYIVTCDGLVAGHYYSKREADSRVASLTLLADQSARVKEAASE